MTPQQGQAQLENQWHVVQTATGGSNTIPTRQRHELGQAHRARMNHQAEQRVTACQAGSSSTQAQWPRKIHSSERNQESCDLSEGGVEQHTRFQHIVSHLLSVARRNAPILLSCHFRNFLLAQRHENLDGSNPILGALNSTSLSRHTCRRPSSTARMLLAVVK